MHPQNTGLMAEEASWFENKSKNFWTIFRLLEANTEDYFSKLLTHIFPSAYCACNFYLLLSGCMAIDDFPIVDGEGCVIGFRSVNNRELDSETNREVVAKELGFESFAAVRVKVDELRMAGLTQAEALLTRA